MNNHINVHLLLLLILIFVLYIGRAAVDREYAVYIYIYRGLAKCSGDGKQKRAPTLMREIAKIL